MAPQVNNKDRFLVVLKLLHSLKDKEYSSTELNKLGINDSDLNQLVILGLIKLFYKNGTKKYSINDKEVVGYFI